MAIHNFHTFSYRTLYVADILKFRQLHSNTTFNHNFYNFLAEINIMKLTHTKKKLTNFVKLMLDPDQTLLFFLKFFTTLLLLLLLLTTVEFAELIYKLHTNIFIIDV